MRENVYTPRYELGIYVKQITCVLKWLVQAQWETVLFKKYIYIFNPYNSKKNVSLWSFKWKNNISAVRNGFNVYTLSVLRLVFLQLIVFLNHYDLKEDQLHICVTLKSKRT